MRKNLKSEKGLTRLTLLLLIIALLSFTGAIGFTIYSQKQEPAQIESKNEADNKNIKIANIAKNESKNEVNNKNKNQSNNEIKSEKNVDEKNVDKLSDVSWKYKKIDFSDLKWLNTEDSGNICIPSNWNRDKDFQILDEDSIVYDLEDASETIIIDSYSSSMLKTRMKSHLEKLADDSQLEEWSYEQLSFGEQNATIVNAKFSGINHIQSTMFIATEDQSRIIEISVEAPDPNVRKLLNTFTFEQIDDDPTDFYNSVNQ